MAALAVNQNASVFWQISQSVRLDLVFFLLGILSRYSSAVIAPRPLDHALFPEKDFAVAPKVLPSQHLIYSRHPGSHRGRNTLHGLPAAMTFSGTSRVTTEQAPMMLRAPMVTPGRTNARAPMNASSPIVILAAARGIPGCSKSWLAVQRYASCATVARAPISISARLYAFARSP